MRERRILDLATLGCVIACTLCVTHGTLAAEERVLFRLEASCATDALCAERVLERMRIDGWTVRPLLQKTPSIFAPQTPSPLGQRNPGAVPTPSTSPARERLSRSYLAVGDGTLDALLALTEVEFAEPDAQGHGLGAPNDTLFPTQWGFEQASNVDVNAASAWDRTTGDPAVLVAVLDTGTTPDHEDLLNIVSGPSFVEGRLNSVDDHGHGSNVGAIACATANNGVGIAGMCPNCSAVAVKVLDQDNRGFYSWWIEGIVYSVDEGADVINLSLGGAVDGQMLHDAVRVAYESGVVVVVAMMNTNGDAPFFPAAYDEAIAVGAIDIDGNRADPFSWGGGSNYGNHIDISAPGADQAGAAVDGSYSYWSGTSQATPIVSGIIGLMLSVNPTLEVEEVRTILRNTARDQIGRQNEDLPGFDVHHGAGLVDASAAVATAAGEEPMVADPEPSDMSMGTDVTSDMGIADMGTADMTATDMMSDAGASDLNPSDVGFPPGNGRRLCQCALRDADAAPGPLTIGLLLLAFVWRVRRRHDA